MGRGAVAGGTAAGPGSGPGPAIGDAGRRGERRVTIADVAARAHVSKSAVSFVFNGRRGLSETTTARILRAAEDLGWRPNARARALSWGRPCTAGLVLQRDAAEAAPDLVAFLVGLGGGLAATGTALVLRIVSSRAEEEDAYAAFARESHVDAVLLTGSRPGDDRPDVLARLGLPFVVADEGIADGPGGGKPGAGAEERGRACAGRLLLATGVDRPA